MSEQPDYGVGEASEISEEFWAAIKKVLPPPRMKKAAGRPRMDDRQAMTAILYVLRTGTQLKRCLAA